MKTLVKKHPKPGLWLTDVDAPPCGPNDVVIKVSKTSICGTDLHIYQWDDWAQSTIKTPITIGHEFVGTIHALGNEVYGFEIGQRATAEGHITCGVCRNCRAGKRHLCNQERSIGVNLPGAFAEFVAVPASNVFPVPDNIDDNTAAILDPLGNAVHCALSFDLVGEDVLITGAGPIGMMATAICRFVGARHVVVTDINDQRLALAKQMGASRVVNVATEPDLRAVIKELGMNSGFDIGLEMSGVPSAMNSLLESMHHGGRVALLGLPPKDTAVDWNQIIFKGLQIKGIFGREIFETWYKMTTMLQSGLDVSSVITHQLPAAEFEQGFDLLQSGEAAKIILDWADI